ncbi:TPA: DUF6508 domain-containing protein, partial [Acinetobacter baumannii]
NENFFNLKQESHIRNVLLIYINNFFKKNYINYKALSEYPRINNTRVDLSIVNLDCPDEIFKIELKFQLVGDYKPNYLIHRKNEIAYDFEEKRSDLFILIIIEWDDYEKLAFDKTCGLEKSLIHYNKGNLVNWREDIFLLFQSFQNTTLHMHKKIEISKPYKTAYQFYFLTNENKVEHPYDELLELIPILEKLYDFNSNDYDDFIHKFLKAMDEHMCPNYFEILSHIDINNETLQNFNEEQLLAFLTESIRKDRFIDWHLRTVIQSGYLLLALNKLWLIVNQEIR